MKKNSIIVVTTLVVVVALFVGCSTAGGGLSLRGLGGFNESSKKSLELFFENVLPDSENKEAIYELCESNKVNVSYSDRNRACTFQVLSSPLSVVVYPQRIALAFHGEYDYKNPNEKGLLGVLAKQTYAYYLSPYSIRFECYGQSIRTSIPSDAVERIGNVTTTNYGTIDTRSEVLDVEFGKDVTEFIRTQWNAGSDMYITITGNGGEIDTKLGKAETSILAVLRFLYEEIEKYSYFEESSKEEISSVVISADSFTKIEYDQISYYVNKNTLLSAAEKKVILDIVATKAGLK